MSDNKDVEGIEQVFAAGDSWLRKYGMVTSIAHNAIVLNLYAAFPKTKYVEYFLPKDTTRRRVLVRLYFPFWKLLFSNKNKLIDEVIFFLKDYLNDYDVRVELKRYKKGVEKSDEVPVEANDLVSDNAAQPVGGESANAESSAEPAGDGSDLKAKPQDEA